MLRDVLLSMLLCSSALGTSSPPSTPTSAPKAATPATAEPAITQAQVLAGLRAVPGVWARYREEQHIALLAEPLVSEGTLHFDPPGRLARRQTSPSQATVVVVDKNLAFKDEFGRDSLDLATNPVVALFVESFLQVLAGDEAGLQRTYAIEFTGGSDDDAKAWTLVLRPRAAPVDQIVDRIVLRGRAAVVRQLEVFERGGDYSVTRLRDVDINHRYTAQEAQRVFIVGGASPSPARPR